MCINNHISITNNKLVSPDHTRLTSLNNASNLIIGYISDLHLDEKIMHNNLSLEMTDDIRLYFQRLVKKMISSMPLEDNLDRKIIFVGDIAHNFQVFKLFFEEYRKMVHDDTFVILGNHELWGEGIDRPYYSIDQIIEYYNIFLSSLSPSIVLLENNLWFPNEKTHVLTKTELLNLDQSEVALLFSRNKYAIFGGIGFAGRNESFNKFRGLYAFAPISRYEEISRSDEVSKIHAKLNELADSQCIFFATHMPLEDWSNDSYNGNWVYFHGHTHINAFCFNDSKKLFANNQIGYSNSPFSLKQIIDKKRINLDYYSDGIHEITRAEYDMISFKLGVGANFNRDYLKIYMIKREGYYMFFTTLPHAASKFILCGGQISLAKHDLQYYYDNICEYAQNVSYFLAPYSNLQNKISEDIKKIGGSGSIHGSIIDIDFYNHIFVNPIDGTIASYYATSKKNKYVYSNITSLLKEKRPDLYSKYLSTSKSDNLPVLASSLMQDNNDTVTLVEDTSMYSVSLKIGNLQRIINNKVIRFWNDDLTKIFTIKKKRIKPPQTSNELLSNANEKKELSTKSIISKKASHKTSSRLSKYIDALAKHNLNILVENYTLSTRVIEYRCKKCNHKWTDKPKPIEDVAKITCPKCKRTKY